MNTQLIQSFVNKVNHEVNELDKEVIGNQVHTKEAMTKIKEMRINLNHLYNLLKIEESLENQREN